MAIERVSKEERERDMFGETIAQMENAKPDHVGNLTYAMGILSDAQEALIFHSPEKGKEIARLYINKAKYFMGKSKENARIAYESLGREFGG